MEFYITSMSAVVGYVMTTIRLDSQLTLREFSEITGSQHTSLSKLERGETSISLDFICIFSSLCKKNPSEFIMLIEDVVNELLLERKVSFVETSDLLKIREIIKHNSDIISPFIINGVFCDQNDPKNLKNELNEKEIKKFVKPIFSTELGRNISPKLHKKIQNFPVKKLNKAEIIESLYINSSYKKLMFSTAAGTAAAVNTSILNATIPIFSGIFKNFDIEKTTTKNQAIQNIGHNFLLRKKEDN